MDINLKKMVYYLTKIKLLLWLILIIIPLDSCDLTTNHQIVFYKSDSENTHTTTQNNNNNNNQQCKFNQNITTGLCVKWFECPQAQIELYFYQIQPTTCWIDKNNEPIVCCLTNNIIESETKRKINQILCENVYSTHKFNSPVPIHSIVGGIPTTDNEIPHMAALGWTQADGTIDWKCGGTLISENYVMTAAHCASNRNIKPDMIRIGEVRLTPESNPTVDFGIIDITVHPEYRSRSFYHDIALIKLNRSVTFSTTVHPACLWQTTNINETEFTATGYGLIEFGGRRSNKLLKAKLSHFDNDSCGKSFVNERALDLGIINGQICAGDSTGERDTCQGDSGGPLQLLLNKVYYIIGITSFGKGCATQLPGVYTRVSHYLDWIEQIVWP